jgi:hypothetical protein
MTIFAQRIIGFACGANEFTRCWDDSFSQRLERVVRVKQTHVIRRHSGRQQCSTVGQHVSFFEGKVKHLLELFERLDAMARLPSPIVPIGVGRIRKETLTELNGQGILNTR